MAVCKLSVAAVPPVDLDLRRVRTRGRTTATLTDPQMASLRNSSDAPLAPHLFIFCFESVRSLRIFTAWLCVYLLLLPVFLFVFYLGYAKRRKRRRDSAPTANISHSDVFTFNMIVMEIVCMVGLSLVCVGFYTGLRGVTTAGVGSLLANSSGQLFFHNLTCVERYLAVVHPITYMRLKKRGGVAIRNVAIGFVWVLYAVMLSAADKMFVFFALPLFSGLVLAVLSLALVSFCSVTVLCVLIRPGPGEGGGDRKRVNQSKRAAFHTMMAILGALLLRLVNLLIYYAVYLSRRRNVDRCLLTMATIWFCLPSRLVLPLLFLHRAGKLPGCGLRK